MNPEQLKSLIDDQISNHNFKYWRPEQISKGRVVPKIISCCDPSNNDEPEDFWLVFVEGDGNGYQVVFDEDWNEFGLATAAKYGGYIFLGIYGTFPETLDAM